jgi:hypothetical protein
MRARQIWVRQKEFLSVSAKFVAAGMFGDLPHIGSMAE